MKQHKRIDIVGHVKLQVLLNLMAIPLFFGFWFLMALLTGINAFSMDLWKLWSIFILLIVFMVVHELIHGLFFKLFHPRDHVKYGYTKGMLYATNPGKLYKRWQFMIIGIMPLILITLALWGLFWIGVIHASVFILVAAFHAAGCVGDLYFEIVLMFSPIGAMVEDTATGMTIYVKQ